MRVINSKYWWLFLLRGLISIIFGVMCLVSPLSMGASLVLVWGAFTLADGVVALWYALSGRASRDPWLVGLQGLIGVILGMIAVLNPLAAGLGMLIVVISWCMVIGVLQIAAAISFRNEMTGEFWLGLSGLVSVGFGILLAAFPALGAVSLVWTLGAFAVAFGATLTGFAFRLKRHASH